METDNKVMEGGGVDVPAPGESLGARPESKVRQTIEESRAAALGARMHATLDRSSSSSVAVMSSVLRLVGRVAPRLAGPFLDGMLAAELARIGSELGAQVREKKGAPAGTKDRAKAGAASAESDESPLEDLRKVST